MGTVREGSALRGMGCALVLGVGARSGSADDRTACDPLQLPAITVGHCREWGTRGIRGVVALEA